MQLQHCMVAYLTHVSEPTRWCNIQKSLLLTSQLRLYIRQGNSPCARAIYSIMHFQPCKLSLLVTLLPLPLCFVLVTIRQQCCNHLGHVSKGLQCVMVVGSVGN